MDKAIQKLHHTADEGGGMGLNSRIPKPAPISVATRRLENKEIDLAFYRYVFKKKKKIAYGFPTL